ncbi:DMT family transporter [Leucobacter triazinivorans]|uniref:Multidrug efflux SMR transporter n=1 Tax=Leucobacter triazinivorans TaxID=1784719 RepID=A0A4P6KD47_9MICO|nr:multidrug efflux SMR transporter [Leucobacter triazinivorans]QBE47788.1 multidrug efflux SMR transporter [Leucobacter triazinivorans]
MAAEGTQKTATAAHWIVLFTSAGLEAAWAIALDQSRGFTVLVPAIVFGVACVLSLAGLGYAMIGIPVSIAYAIWTGLGAALTVGASILLGIESPSPLKLLFLAGIVGCVIGLKFAKAPARATPTPTPQPRARG